MQPWPRPMCCLKSSATGETGSNLLPGPASLPLPAKEFPLQQLFSYDVPNEIAAAFDRKPVDCLKAEDFLVVFETESDVRSAAPNFGLLAKLGLRGVIITAPSGDYDFVSRFFAPKYGIPEDPVTGSAYTQLAPYWASRTGRQNPS